ncbi:MAG: putative FMN-binding protein [Solirubrobacterales bacterium]|nr:putative FMN-binding protein [Solirubrobacterales bacterium]
MRRAPIILTATIAGTAAVVSFNPRPQSLGPITEAALPAVSATQQRTKQTKQTTRSRPRPKTSKRDGIFMGATVPNQYGPVQVQVAISAGRIVDVRAIQLPSADGQSQEINASAAPQLKVQALQKQSAKVDGVSGATYTSDGYRASLQAALDRAHF